MNRAPRPPQLYAFLDHRTSQNSGLANLRRQRCEFGEGEASKNNRVDNQRSRRYAEQELQISAQRSLEIQAEY